MEHVQLLGALLVGEAEQDPDRARDVDRLRLLEQGDDEHAARSREDAASREIARREEERTVEPALRVAEEEDATGVEADLACRAGDVRRHLHLRLGEEARLLDDVDRRLAIVRACGECVVEVEEEQLDLRVALWVVRRR